MSDIFISYKRSDEINRVTIGKISDLLEECGFRVFGERAARSDSFLSNLDANLIGSSRVIALIGQGYFESQLTSDEFNYAYRFSRIIPCAAESFSWDDASPALFEWGNAIVRVDIDSADFARWLLYQADAEIEETYFDFAKFNVSSIVKNTEQLSRLAPAYERGPDFRDLGDEAPRRDLHENETRAAVSLDYYDESRCSQDTAIDRYSESEKLLKVTLLRDRGNYCLFLVSVDIGRVMVECNVEHRDSVRCVFYGDRDVVGLALTLRILAYVPIVDSHLNLSVYCVSQVFDQDRAADYLNLFPEDFVGD